MSERLPPEFLEKYKMGRMIGEGQCCCSYMGEG